MAISDTPSVYRIYLLTVWQEPGLTEADDLGWRFHLTDPWTGKRYGFTNPQALFTVLQQITSNCPSLEDS